MVSSYLNNATSLTSLKRATCPKPSLSRLQCPPPMLFHSSMGIPFPTPPLIAVLSAPYNTSPSLDRISPLLSTKSPSLCLDPPLSIFKLLNSFCATSNLHSLSVSFFASHPLATSKLTLTLTRVVAPMTGNPPRDFVSFLALISSHGPYVNNKLLLDPAPNPNIVPL
jgi:hypothetical protein